MLALASKSKFALRVFSVIAEKGASLITDIFRNSAVSKSVSKTLRTPAVRVYPSSWRTFIKTVPVPAPLIMWIAQFLGGEDFGGDSGIMYREFVTGFLLTMASTLKTLFMFSLVITSSKDPAAKTHPLLRSNAVLQ